MGNSSEQAGSPLKFIQNIEEARLGDIDIYQNDEGRFVMKTVKTHIIGDRRHNEFKRIMSWVEQGGSKLVVPVISTTHKHQKNLCVQYEIASLYMEYYNYTLKDLIASGKGLEEGELWMVLAQLLGLVVELKKHKIGINLQVDNVFLTLKGQPAVYAHHLLSFQDTICISNLGMGQLIAKLVLQLASLQLFQNSQDDEQKQMLAPLAKLCARSRLIGTVLRELLYRQRPEHEILQEISALVAQDKIKVAHQIKLIKFKYMIPEKKEEKREERKEERGQRSIGGRGGKNTGKKINQRQAAELSSHGVHIREKEEILNTLNKRSLNKQAVDKMLADISEKKQLNLEKMHRFQQKKDQLILNSVRNQDFAQSLVRKGDGKENITLAKNMRKSQKKGKSDHPRKATEPFQHNHLR